MRPQLYCASWRCISPLLSLTSWFTWLCICQRNQMLWSCLFAVDVPGWAIHEDLKRVYQESTSSESIYCWQVHRRRSHWIFLSCRSLGDLFNLAMGYKLTSSSIRSLFLPFFFYHDIDNLINLIKKHMLSPFVSTVFFLDLPLPIHLYIYIS